MEWKNVESSNVEAIAYSEQDEAIYVQFKSGGEVYVYSDCPPEVWDEFQASSSKGRFVNLVLKRSHPYTCLGDIKAKEK